MSRSLADVVADLRDALFSPARFGQFVGVGAVGAAVDLTISSTITLAGLLNPEWAKLLGAECAIVVMFLVNDHWTFANHGADGPVSKLRRLLTSNLVRSGGLAVQFTVVYLLTRLGVRVVVYGTDIWALLTLPVAIGCSFLVNYVAESLFTWRVQKRP